MFEKINKAIINGKCFTEDTEILLYEKPENRISIYMAKTDQAKVLWERQSILYIPKMII